MSDFDKPFDDFFRFYTSAESPNVYKDTITEFMEMKMNTYNIKLKDLKEKEIEDTFSQIISLSLITIFDILTRLSNEITFLKSQSK